jgi:hypothetical protein
MLGYEIRAIPKPPRWAKPTDAPLDEEIPGPWMYHVLQMSNHGSMRLEYHRMIWGDDPAGRDV